MAGAFTITAGLALFVWGIVSTDTRPWGSAQTVTALAGGAASLSAALFIEARLAPSPLVPLRIGRRLTGTLTCENMRSVRRLTSKATVNL